MPTASALAGWPTRAERHDVPGTLGRSRLGWGRHQPMVADAVVSTASSAGPLGPGGRADVEVVAAVDHPDRPTADGASRVRSRSRGAEEDHDVASRFALALKQDVRRARCSAW